jgi:uncharacterized membrane protein
MFAFLAYFLSIIGFIIVLAVKKDNKFAMFHAKQSLVLFIAAVANGVLYHVPIVGLLVGALVGLAITILWIMGIVYSLTGQQTNLPIVGDIAAKINI